MNLARLALDNSRITILAMLLVLVVGITTYVSYPSAEDPTIQIRNVAVTAAYPGMSAERIEDLLAQPLEAAMREIAEIEDINSISQTGNVRLELQIHDWVTELEPVFRDIRNKVQDIKGTLPEGTKGPNVFDDEGLTAVATVALWADGFSLAEMRDVARDVRDVVYTLDGIRKVEILGVQEERIYLEVNPAKLAEFGIPPQEIFGALAQQNIVEPGGQISVDGMSITLEPTGNLHTVGDVGDVVFRVPGSDQVLPLRTLVDIRRTYMDPPSAPVFFNNRPAIILSISTIEGANNVAFGKRLTTIITDLQQELPIGYVLEYATFQPELIEQAIQGAVSNVYQTLLVVLAVVIIFLGVRTGLIVGSFVPLTMLFGIIVMRLLEVELQRMSIAAMIIALGMLVDNGIVMAEDIRVRLERGVARVTAAVDATRTLALPLLTSSLTTVFAFLPMLLTEGGAGEYISSLAQVVAILLLGSWLLSMTVTPAMCVWFLKVTPTDIRPVAADPYGSRFYRAYRMLLSTILRWRLSFIGVIIALFFGTIYLLGTVRTEFFPLGDRNQILVYLDFQAGTDIRATQAETRKLTAWLSDKAINPQITSNVAYVATGGPRFFLALSPVDPDPHRAFVLINLQSADDVGLMIERVNSFMGEQMPGAQGDAKRLWFGATEPGIVQLRLSGPDGDKLFALGEQLVGAFHAVPGATGVKQDWENKLLTLIVEVDQIRARRAGVSSRDVAGVLSGAYSGTTVSDFRDGDKVLPIMVRATEDLRFSIGGLQRIQIYSQQQNEFVSLGQVATVRPEWRFSRIKRHNQRRTLTVEARNPNTSSGALLEAVRPTLDSLDFPPGYRWEVGGEIEDQAKANANLFSLLPIALGGIVLLLVGQFNSMRKGGVIMSTIPLILIGGTLGLIIMDAAYGFMVLLGFFSLAGILINNGIVLVDRINQETESAGDQTEAVILACLARLRPILMTTLTTVLGLIPLIISGGALFYGMASVIAFGLIVGTVLTLGFVPVVYTLLFRIAPPAR